MTKEGASGKNDKKSRVIVHLTVVTTLVICALVASIFWVMLLNNQKDELMQTTKLISTESQRQEEEIKSLRSNLIKKDIELDKLKQRLEGIKDKDDLLSRDIFVYIDENYLSIPSSVARDISKNIIEISKKYEMSPELIVGMIQVESSFNPMAVSSKHARGLMQVMPEWIKKLDNISDANDLHDIDKNIDAGIQVLLIHIEEADGSLSKGLYHYVGKSKSYVDNVYQAMGQFIAFRSTIDDEKINGGEKESDKNETKQGTTGGN